MQFLFERFIYYSVLYQDATEFLCTLGISYSALRKDILTSAGDFIIESVVPVGLLLGF